MAIDHKIPLPVPDLDGITKPQGTELTPTQQECVDKVIAHFSVEGYSLPGLKEDEDKDNGKLSEEERYWLSYECILRFLRATKWAGADVAIKRLEGTLKWRREFGLYDRVTAEYVEPEAVTGKQIIFGFDSEGRPALYLVPSRQNTTESERQIHFVIWALEKVVELMGPGVETLTLMINFADRAKNPSFSTSKTVLDILQTHYPEHLGRAIIINIPFLINAFFKLIVPFVDPITRVKMKFNPQVVQEGLFSSHMVWKEFGGECEFTYDHGTYWPALVRMCEERKREKMEAWRELGGKVGLKEWDVRSRPGSSASSVAENPSEVKTLEDTAEVRAL